MKWPSHHVNAIRNQKVMSVWNSRQWDFSHVNTPLEGGGNAAIFSFTNFHVKVLSSRQICFCECIQSSIYCLFDELKVRGVRPFRTALPKKSPTRIHPFFPKPTWSSRQLLNVSSFNIKALITSRWTHSACFSRSIEMSYKNVSGDTLSYFYEPKNISHSVAV